MKHWSSIGIIAGILFLGGCGQHPQTGGTEPVGIEQVKLVCSSFMKERMPCENMQWDDKASIAVFEQAVKTAEKLPGVMDYTSEYMMTFTYSEGAAMNFSIGVGPDRTMNGLLVYEEDTHTGYSIPVEQSNAIRDLIEEATTDNRSSGNDEVDQERDVINLHGIQVHNRELLDAWMEQGSGSQRIVHYTIEGDPIFHTVSHDQGKVKLVVDTTHDKFGAPTVSTLQCEALDRAESDTALVYTLKGCSGDSSGERNAVVLLEINYNMQAQDRFDFVLKYGPNLESEIHTADQSVQFDLGQGESLAVSDFQLPSKDLQAIYKQLVLANYLGNKKLTVACKKDASDVSYDMTVWINGGEVRYQWAACDFGKDGREMTEIANQIITSVKERLEAYQ
ncbi:hypothetical protein FHS18_003938 [Paenibacillus phyllosphaerae]|uniref:YhfM-like domain-containing protein n=1 Tax=Paenibacillus phyllosphaerae TaxID=274593 RepID=A0A7W5AZW8_9BACL|nr:DUF4362 domain-containing protein [Paenibacillus phyllosphaerae]MBB3111870.1 hypothetical protein [Paenibacillus phyllosphaerae]